METKVKDLTVVEFQSLISDTMRATLEDLIEDVSALSSPDYLKSIEEARNDYRGGICNDAQQDNYGEPTR